MCHLGMPRKSFFLAVPPHIQIAAFRMGCASTFLANV